MQWARDIIKKSLRMRSSSVALIVHVHVLNNVYNTCPVYTQDMHNMSLCWMVVWSVGIVDPSHVYMLLNL